MSEKQNILQEQITAKAMKDEAFRQQLLSNPKVTLEREFGIDLPADGLAHENKSRGKSFSSGMVTRPTC